MLGMSPRGVDKLVWRLYKSSGLVLLVNPAFKTCIKSIHGKLSFASDFEDSTSCILLETCILLHL